MSDSHEPPGSPEAAAALLDALSVAGGGSGGVPAWFEELLGVDFEYSLEQEFQSFEEQTLNATFTVAQIIPLVDKIPALIRENCSGTGVSTALDQIGGDSSSSAADHLGEYLKAEFRKHFGGSAGEEDRPFPLSGEAFVQFGKYLALKGYLKGIASVQTASEGAGGGGAADEAAPAASDMENVAISGSEGFSESEAQKVARDEVAQERTNDLVSTAVGEIIARKTPSTPTAERQGGVVAGKGAATSSSGPPAARSSGSSSRVKSSSSSAQAASMNKPKAQVGGSSSSSKGKVSHTPPKKSPPPKMTSSSPPNKPKARPSAAAATSHNGPPGGSSSGGIAAAASPSKYHQVQPFFRTGPMPLPKQKVDTAAKIKYPKLRPDARFQTMAGNLRGTTTKGSFSPRRIPSVLDKREAITLFLWLEEDVKNVYEFRDRVGNGMPLWLDGVLHGEDFKEKVEKAFHELDSEGDGILPVFVLQEVVKNLRSYLPQEGAAQVDIKPVVHHFKNIYPPGKNLGLEDFVEACIFLVARAWIADQMGGEAQGTFAPSPKVKLPQIHEHTGSAFFDGIRFPKWEGSDSELVTKLKNEVSWLHAQLAEQRKLEYKTFSSGPDVEKKTRNRREGLNPLEMNENNPLYSAAKAPPLRYGVMSDKVLREHEQSITSKISITSESAQKPNSVSSGAVQVVKNIADGVHGGPLDGSRGAEEEQPGRFKKASDFFHIPMKEYTKEDLIMEIRHLQLDVDFYKSKASSSDRKELFAEHAEQKIRIRSMQNKIRFLTNQLQHKEVELEHSTSLMHGSSTWSTNVSQVLPSQGSSTQLAGGASTQTEKVGGGGGQKKQKRSSSEAVLKLAQEALQKERAKRKFAERRLAEERDSVARLTHQAKVADMEVQKMGRAMAKTMGY